MVRSIKSILLLVTIIVFVLSCNQYKNKEESMQSNKTAADILGNSDYLAISYGGYRQKSRDIQPTVSQLKEDMKILSAMGIKLIRTYNVKLAHASNVLKAINQLKKEDRQFEMYVMLGAWIDCKNAWTDLEPDHNVESESNKDEIERAIALANLYPDIVKIIAVGNEAMVKWASAYYVQPGVILKWVNHLQALKSKGNLPKDLWITSSDNFASWGGGSDEYHVDDLNKLIKAVDYVSMHTYPMHDTHYNPVFWGMNEGEDTLADQDVIQNAMIRAKDYAESQYRQVKEYVGIIDPSKPIHIGETGWASASNGLYGINGSKATDEYKEGLYYQVMREWTNEANLSCFYFQAFDEPWKDAKNPGGSENYFGLITVDGKAKYPLWSLVDKGAFEGLSRGGNAISKTYNGNEADLLKDVLLPPINKSIENVY